MSDSSFDAESIVSNFSQALESFMAQIKPLAKTPLKIPEISADSDDAKKRAALREILESLADAKDDRALDESDIDRASEFFASLYGGDGYRHRYADICDLVLNALGESDDGLDNGVPYSVNCLAENIGTIYEHMVEFAYGDQAKSVLKLADHIDLERTRLRHYIKQNDTMIEFRGALNSLREEREESERQRSELELSLQDEFNKRLDQTKAEYIGILGIFSAVVLVFNGAVGFSSASISSLGTASGVRALVLIVALVGFILINAICILLVFLWKMSFNYRKIDLGKWPRNCLIAADVFLISIMAMMLALGHPFIRGIIGLS